MHADDIKNLLGVLKKLRDKENTVVVIEHNMNIIKSADNIIDLGPEGGKEGGEIIAEGTPEQITESDRSQTGKYLSNVL